MTADEHPELRCRCVHRAQYPDAGSDCGTGGYPDDYYDRCRHAATAEDGTCDHCRQSVAPDGCPMCGPDWRTCCRREDQRRGARFVTDPRTPCLALREPSEVAL